jgi:hypothetical protein
MEVCSCRFLDQRSGDDVEGVKSWIQPHTARSKWAAVEGHSGEAIGRQNRVLFISVLSHQYSYSIIKMGSKKRKRQEEYFDII